MILQPLIGGVLALSSIASTSPTPKKPHFSWKKTKSLIAFGDSYTSIQGLLGHPNYTYIGDNFTPSFTADKLFSNRIVQNQTGTASGGPIWTQHLTSCGVARGLTDPRTCKKQLWDFAYAGANTDTLLTPLHWNHTVSLEAQVLQFERYGDPALQRVLRRKDALVAFWIGINDINDLAKLRGKNETFAPLYESIISAQQKLWDRVYALGYSNFLLLNLPPLDRGPRPSVNESAVATYNAILKEHSDAFQENRKDATVLFFDVNKVLNRVFDEAAKYGFKNTTGFCPGFNQPDVETQPEKYGCGEGLDTYLWYNSGHLTSRVHEVFSGALRRWLGERGWGGDEGL